MGEIKYYRVGQFTDPAPADHERFTDFIKSGEADKVDKDYEPIWGDAVFALHPDGEITLHKQRYDTSD